MTFFLLLLVSLIVGIFACMPLARYISPPTGPLLIALFAPWTTMYFVSQDPLINTIRAMYLSFFIGMCVYWTYFETIKKLNKLK